MFYFRALVFFLCLQKGFSQDDDEEDFLPEPIRREVSDVCGPSGLGLHEFTGFRVQHQMSVDFPFVHHTRVTHCVNNEVHDWDAYYPVNRTEDVKWGQRFCTAAHNSGGACFIMARRKVAAKRTAALFYHGDWVGGIFRCPGTLDDDHLPCNNENAFPLYPLMADEPYFDMLDLPDLRHLLRRVPLVLTASAGLTHTDVYRYYPYNWWKYIDIHEDYDYSEDERILLRRVLDTMANTFWQISTVYVGRIIMPLTEEFYTDVGDGKARRSTYKGFARTHFEPDNWKAHQPFARNREFENDTPILGIEESDNRLTQTLEASVSFDSSSLSSLEILRYIHLIPKEVFNNFKKGLSQKFESAILEDGPIYTHPPPPSNVLSFLNNPY